MYNGPPAITSSIFETSARPIVRFGMPLNESSGAARQPDAAVPFNRPFIAGREVEYIQQAIANGQISGDGVFTKRCQSILEELVGCQRALLTTSCTDALEMAALLLEIQPGDEVI